MRKALLILAVVMLSGASPRALLAQDSGGAEAFEFLLLDADARAVAMGGAMTSLATDSNAMRYNPAGLARVQGFEGTLMHNQYLQEATQEYLSLASPWGLGFSVNYLHVGGITRTTLAQPSGTGKLDVGDLAIGVGYGRTFYDTVSVGAGFKYIRQTLDTIEAKVYAVDVGGLYTNPDWPGLSLGGSVLNIGPDPDFERSDEKLPLLVRGGASYAFPFMGNENLLAFDIIKPRTDQLRFGLGAETTFAKKVAFRLGLATSHDAGFGLTGGVGWLSPSLSLNYAVVPFGDLGISHSFSLTYRWGFEPKEEEPVAPREAPAASGPVATIEQRFIRAEQLIRAGSFDKARAELGQAFGQMGPNDARQIRYHERLGSIALREKNVEKAKASFMEALRVGVALGSRDASVADAYAGMGLCLARQKDAEYALRFFNKALEANASPETRALVEQQIRDLKAGR